MLFFAQFLMVYWKYNFCSISVILQAIYPECILLRSVAAEIPISDHPVKLSRMLNTDASVMMFVCDTTTALIRPLM